MYPYSAVSNVDVRIITSMVIKTDSSHEAEGGGKKDRQVSLAKVKTRLSVK